jgi:hypothetical protein
MEKVELTKEFSQNLPLQEEAQNLFHEEDLDFELEELESRVALRCTGYSATCM